MRPKKNESGDLLVSEQHLVPSLVAVILLTLSSSQLFFHLISYLGWLVSQRILLGLALYFSSWHSLDVVSSENFHSLQIQVDSFGEFSELLLLW